MPYDAISTEVLNQLLPRHINPTDNLQNEVAANVNALRNIDFINGDLDGNFQKLREQCGLMTPDDHVSSLITAFSIDTNQGTPLITEVGDGKYKSALFLYWLAGDKDVFTMDEDKRNLVRTYFGDEICQDALNNRDTKHQTVKDLLFIGNNVTVVIERPNK